MASGVLMATNISSKQQKERKFLKKSASLDDMIDEKKVKENSMESKSKLRLRSKSESEESALKDKKHKSSTKKPNSAMTARGTVKLKDEKRSKFSFSLFGGLTFSKPKVKQRTVLSPAVTRKTNDVINTLGNSKSNPKQKRTRTRSKSKDRGSIIESHTSGTSSRSHTKPRECTALGTYKEKIKTKENSKERSKHGINGNKSPSISSYQGKRSHMPLPPIPQLPEVLEEDSEEFHSALGLALAAKMLQQILQDMYIDPDLLAELSEEQKQILFCKMREEQVRRYNEYEEKVDTEKRKPPRPRKPGRRAERIQFLEGKDGNEWVWVMGEHKNDKPIEQIIEEEAQLKAAKLAEVEAEELRNQEETEIAKKAAQEQARLEREKQAQEEELRRQEEEARLYQTLKEAKMAEQKLQEERRKREEEEKRKLKEIEQTQVLRRRKTRESVKQLKERRSSDIYMSFKKARQNFEKTAQETMTKVEVEWKEREKKAKEFDEEKRAIARRAREEHRKSLSMKHSGKVIGAVTAMMRRHTVVGAPPPMTSSNNNSPGSKSRPPRPDDRDAVIDWFKDVEKQKNVGKDPKTRNVEPWFHGVITRVEAESLLENKRVGTYLVRVSEKVWGYTISFKDEDRCKHFLIDTSDDSYQFFGTNQIAHKSLLDLVCYHQKKPISGVGQEVLLFPCGQMRDPPDYYELFQNDKVEVTAL